MRNTAAKAAATAMLLSMLLNFLTGCFLKAGIVDGPGMVNYPGLLLHTLTGDWTSDGDGSHRLTIREDSTLSLRHNDALLIADAVLTLHTASANTDEYCAFDISPNVFTDETGGSAEITKASYENGVITLELTASGGSRSVLTFSRVPDQEGPELLDGPGMIHYGRVLDDAITGCWYSADGRFVLDMNGRYADFTADGKLLASKDDGYFADHSYFAEGNLNERCELYPTGNYMDDSDEPPFTITGMWYQAEHIYMNVAWPDGTTGEVVFGKAS